MIIFSKTFLMKKTGWLIMCTGNNLHVSRLNLFLFLPAFVSFWIQTHNHVFDTAEGSVQRLMQSEKLCVWKIKINLQCLCPRIIFVCVCIHAFPGSWINIMYLHMNLDHLCTFKRESGINITTWLLIWKNKTTTTT